MKQDAQYMIYLLALAALIALWLAVRAHQSRTSRIDLSDLVTGNDGKIASDKLMMWLGYSAMLWAFVYLTFTDKMTEGYFGAFGLTAVAPFLTRLLKAEPAPLPPKE